MIIEIFEMKIHLIDYIFLRTAKAGRKRIQHFHPTSFFNVGWNFNVRWNRIFRLKVSSNIQFSQFHPTFDRFECLFIFSFGSLVFWRSNLGERYPTNNSWREFDKCSHFIIQSNLLYFLKNSRLFGFDFFLPFPLAVFFSSLLVVSWSKSKDSFSLRLLILIFIQSVKHEVACSFLLLQSERKLFVLIFINNKLN